MRALVIAHLIAALAGAPASTTINCNAPGRGDINGYTLTSPGQPPLIELTSWVCNYLVRRNNPFLLGIGVHLVVHEASHARGIVNEYEAESRTQRLMPRILRELLPRLGDHGRRFRQAFRDALQGSQGWHDVLPWRYQHSLRDQQDGHITK